MVRTIYVLIVLVCFSLSCSGGPGSRDGSDADDGASDSAGDETEGDTADADEPDAEPLCGNGELDGDEECDDGNDVSGDGCDDCTWSCRDNGDCKDEDACNGRESCNMEDHLCEPGEPEEDGFVCKEGPRSICLDGDCLESRCGDGFVDSGGDESCEPPGEDDCKDNCKWKCEGAVDCPDDGDVCNGEEFCDLILHECSRHSVPRDGTVCGEDPRQICVDGDCRPGACGDLFIDFEGGEECEDGDDVNGDGCDEDCTFSCHEVDDCIDGLVCTEDFCHPDLHRCAHEIRTDSRVCRESTGLCDPEERCDGVNAECPDDAFISAAEECRDSAGECDAPERCPGDGPDCPGDAFYIPGYPCTDEGVECTDDVCDGMGGCIHPLSEDACRIDAVCYLDGDDNPENTCQKCDSASDQHGWTDKRSGDRCDDGKYCTGNDECQNDGSCRGPLIQLQLYDALQVAAGRDFSCALVAVGGSGARRVKCWGDNTLGQLGNGTTIASSAPVDVADLPSGLQAVAAGARHACALLETGGVKCWGSNVNGQLGNGTSVLFSTRPVNVIGLSSGVRQIDSHNQHTCALLGGGVRCWGGNGYGQCGDGTADTPKRIPVDVTGLPENVDEVSSGGYHTCVHGAEGAVHCWGDNEFGQVGDGTVDTPVLDPVFVDHLGATVSVSAGGNYTCARIGDGGGEVKCWGRNDVGQCGDNTTDTPRLVPVHVVKSTGAVLIGVESLNTGGGHSCVVTTDGLVYCWGYNDDGQCGTGDTVTPQPAAIQAGGLGGRAIEAAPSIYNHTCVLNAAGAVFCWGNNETGQCGNGTEDSPLLVPRKVVCG
ncbi:MAG: DUF4215 domain-containing protein [Pseudomonadota bacterium]